MKLGIVYHMPFWRAADGTLREVEGSFARYVDSLAPYFDEISLCVPVLAEAQRRGHADSSQQRHPRAAAELRRPGSVLSAAADRWCRASCGSSVSVDLVHCRVPTPAAVIASRLRDGSSAGLQFLLVVGDLRALLPTMPYRGVKRLLWRAYTAFEECNIQWMADHALTFANGEALTLKHSRDGRAVIRTQTTTIDADAIGIARGHLRRAARSGC